MTFVRHKKNLEHLYADYSSGNVTEESTTEVAYVKLISNQLSLEDRNFYLEKLQHLDRPIFKLSH